MPPNACMAASIMRRTSASCATSPAEPWTLAPVPASAATSASSAAASRSLSSSAAPSAAKRSAVARPMPLAAPVMTAVLPARRPDAAWGMGISPWVMRRGGAGAAIPAPGSPAACPSRPRRPTPRGSAPGRCAADAARHLEAVARRDRAVGRALDAEHAAAFDQRAAFDARMRVAGHDEIRVDVHQHLQRDHLLAGILGLAEDGAGEARPGRAGAHLGGQQAAGGAQGACGKAASGQAFFSPPRSVRRAG